MTNDGVVNTFVLASSVAVRVLPKADSKEWDYPVVVSVIRCCSRCIGYPLLQQRRVTNSPKLNGLKRQSFILAH